MRHSYKAARFTSMTTRNPYLLRCSSNTDVPGSAYQISRPLGGAHEVSLNTGASGIEVAGLLVLLAQLFQELNDSDDTSTSFLRDWKIRKTVNELLGNLKALITREKTEHVPAWNHQKMSENLKNMLQNISSGVSSRDGPLEDMGRHLGRNLVDAIYNDNDKNRSTRAKRKIGDTQPSVIRSV